MKTTPSLFLQFQVNSEIFDNREIPNLIWPFLVNHKDSSFSYLELKDHFNLLQEELAVLVDYLISESIVTTNIPSSTYSDWEKSSPQDEALSSNEDASPALKPKEGNIVTFDIE